jgi:tetratricopeptide (TPR) repeat protein
MESSQANNQLKQRIAAWLAVTKGEEIAVGLSEDEATRRAQSLLDSILDGSVSSESIIIDDDFKQVVSVAIALLREREGESESKLRRADAVYKFIDRLDWPTDPLGEKRDLLIECAEIGWGVVAPLANAIARRREALLEDRDLSAFPVSKEAEEVAGQFFSGNRSELIATSEVLFAFCSLLRRNLNAMPVIVLERGIQAFKWLSRLEGSFGILEEIDYFLGRIAFEVGGCCRHLGRGDEAERWLDHSERLFTRTVDSNLTLAQVSYSRLTLAYERGEHALVIECSPAVALLFERAGTNRWFAKTQLLRGGALKFAGRVDEAVKLFASLRTSEILSKAPDLLAYALGAEGEIRAIQGDLHRAFALYDQALKILKTLDEPLALGTVRVCIGEAYRQMRRWPEALQAFSSGLKGFENVGMAAMAARARLLIAETLLFVNREREAEQQILAALPAIEKQKMVPEGFAAVALLKESVRRRKTDHDALRELRERLQGLSKRG